MSTSDRGERPLLANRKQRRLRNYLLDHRFQLKYTAYLAGVAVALSIVLGTLLWSASGDMISQSEETVKRAQETVRQGQEVVRESRKVSAVVQMNIVKDPVYADNPELLSVFNGSAKEQDRRLEDQQRSLEADAVLLQRRAAELAIQQQRMLTALIAALAFIVVVIGAAGIVVTHKIAGPVHKMKRLIKHVGEGNLNLHEGLRKGDELRDFFDAFVAMVHDLRRRQDAQIAQIEEVLARLRPIAQPDDIAPLQSLLGQLKKDLQEPTLPPPPPKTRPQN